MKFIVYKNRKQFCADMKQIYSAINEEQAVEALKALKAKWKKFILTWIGTRRKRMLGNADGRNGKDFSIIKPLSFYPRKNKIRQMPYLLRCL